MKHKWKPSITKGLCVVLASTMIMECSGWHNLQALNQVHAEESQVAESAWDGVTREKIWELDRCRVVYSLINNWEDGYTTSVRVENTSDEAIDNWHVSFPVQEEIVDIWNVQMIDAEDGTTVFKNLGWNQDIAAGQSISFGFTAKEAFTGFPEICELPASRQYVDEKDYEITYQVTNAWDTGHNGEICIRNVSDKAIEDWFVSFDCTYEISDLWNGKIVSSENGRYLIQNKDYNQNIAAGAELRVGFTVQCPKEETPSGYRLEQIALGGGKSEPGTTDGGDVSGSDVSNGDVSNGDVSGGDVSGSDITKTLLTIDTKQFDYNEAADYYLTQEHVEKLTGTLTDAEQVEKLKFTVTDINGLVVDKGECAVKENWIIDDIGFVIGYNVITVTAVCENGEKVAETISLMNFNPENVDATDVDRDDTDGDGIDNYTETIFGTDPLSDDSDGDKIKDLDEMSQTGTNPNLADTDEDDIDDGQEDPDEDGLCNLEEIKAGTNPLYEDYDNDKLSDGDEVLKYHTDPLVEDTDEDGLRDGEDVIMGYEPWNPDTDGDGILDGDEVVYQTAVEEIDQERVAGITMVAVSMDCAGYIDNEVSIFNVYNLDMRTTDVVGRVGAAVDIETTQEFDEATITFTYDEEALGDSLEDNLRIVWYDEENDQYVVMDEETVIDKENNTLSCKTTHFSTWLVVDVLKWIEVINSIKIEEQPALTEYEVDHYLIMDWAGFSPVIDIILPDNIHAYSVEFVKSTMYYPEGSDEIDESGNRGAGRAYDYIQCSKEEILRQAITEMIETENGVPNKQLFYFSLKDTGYYPDLVELAKENGIKFQFLSSHVAHNSNMFRMAEETGGAVIPLTSWRYSEQVRLAKWNILVDMAEEQLNKGRSYKDSDEDGLYDFYETNGMLISNGTFVYTDPDLTDSDGDEISDFVEVGGLPIEVKLKLLGKEYTVPMFKGALYEMLSDDFIFVDGTPNEDGTVITRKMDYVPYLDGKNKVPWYIGTIINEETGEKKVLVNYELLGESRPYHYMEEVHNLFADKADQLTDAEKFIKYESWNAMAIGVLFNYTTRTALDCFYTFIQGEGADKPGIEGMGSRKYVNIDKMLGNPLHNSARKCYKENMTSAVFAAKSVLNKYNTEVYIAVAPTANWSGCTYWDDVDTSDVFGTLLNMDAFGAFNKADAVVTLHCIYDPEKDIYTFDYIYYLTDYYNFDIAPTFEEQNMLGYSKSYELYGKADGKGIVIFDNLMIAMQIPDIF